MELCNKGYNSNLKNLLVKHQNSSVYWHRWRLLSGVSLIFFYGIIGKFSSLNYMGGSPSTNGRLQGYIPGIMKCQKFWVGAEKARLFIGRNCTCRGCFIKSRSVFSWQANRHRLSRAFRSARGQEHESIEFLCEMGWFFSLE